MEEKVSNSLLNTRADEKGWGGFRGVDYGTLGGRERRRVYFSCCRAMVFWILAVFEAMMWFAMG